MFVCVYMCVKLTCYITQYCYGFNECSSELLPSTFQRRRHPRGSQLTPLTLRSLMNTWLYWGAGLHYRRLRWWEQSEDSVHKDPTGRRMTCACSLTAGHQLIHLRHTLSSLMFPHTFANFLPAEYVERATQTAWPGKNNICLRLFILILCYPREF